MSSDIITCLNLNEENGNNKVVVVREINCADSCFIISSVLGHCIKNKKSVLIISIHNSLTHLQNVGLKMNYNLQRHMESALIKHFDLGFELVGALLEGKPITIDNLLIKIRNIISEIQDKSGKCNVIIDGITQLFDLQFSLKDINKFCTQIIKYVREDQNSFVLLHCNVASEFDVSNTLASLICHRAHTVIEVGSLSSGLSADVSGNMTIRHPGQKFEEQHMFRLQHGSMQYLYKLFDRGVKLFAPGTV